MPASTGWFEDLPLDWTRREVRQMAAALEVGYPTSADLVSLARNAGLSVAAMNQAGSVRQLAREVLDRARLSNRLVQLIVEVFDDPDVEAVHTVLRDILSTHEAAFQTAALTHRPSLATLSRMPPDITVQGPSGPETVLNVLASFEDPAVFRTRLAEAEVRIAQILIGGGPAGSGFLIGDSLLLTNWHVVASLQGTDASTAMAVFDHKRRPDGGLVDAGRAVAFGHPWLLAASPHAALAVETTPDGPTDDFLDYALVALSEPAGRQGIGSALDGDPRGHFPIGSGRREVDSAEPLLALGHPFAGPLQLSFASPSGAALSGRGTRLRYRLNTSPGSSGSPVLDRAFSVVALHHHGAATENQGVPISKVVADVRRRNSDEAVLSALEDGGHGDH